MEAFGSSYTGFIPSPAPPNPFILSKKIKNPAMQMQNFHVIYDFHLYSKLNATVQLWNFYAIYCFHFLLHSSLTN